MPQIPSPAPISEGHKSQQQELMALRQKMKTAEQTQREGLPFYDDLQKDTKQSEHGNAMTHHVEVDNTANGNVR
jgi:hypothetical protein